MRLDCWIASSVLQMCCYWNYKKFKNALYEPDAVQESVLRNILKRNSLTEYGKVYNFSKIKSVKEFQEQVPITNYDFYKNFINRIQQGELNVLTPGFPIRFHLSSGTTAPSKLIPFTKSLRNEFLKGIRPWLYNLFQNNPGLKNGTAYFVLSPLGSGESPGNVPIGFDQDHAYFSLIERALINRFMSIPNSLQQIDDVDAVSYLTLIFLLSDKNLKWLSIWSPAFLTALLGKLMIWKDDLLEGLRTGELRCPLGYNFPEICKDLRIPHVPKRARELESLLKFHCAKQVKWEKVWPRLELISCWEDAWANYFVEDLKLFFPNVKVQGKGLLATEGFVSLPHESNGTTKNILSICSHFFEFVSLKDGKAYLVSEIETGEEYGLLLTTSGGLYRYSLQDRIVVTGRHCQTPIIKFLGKTNTVSDLFGEKLNRSHVESALSRAFHNFNYRPQNFFLIPYIRNGKGFYVLCVDIPLSSKEQLKEILDQYLSENFNYQYCRSLNQLEKPEMVSLPKNFWRAREKFKSARNSIYKPSCLELDFDQKLKSLIESCLEKSPI